ncbi:MAG: hypothetical protein N4A74_25500 [Carboxylicivirga sp.]|jgi:hypothetical protein|nr:hypothetical protein [Carboxylicivirga sp.]
MRKKTIAKTLKFVQKEQEKQEREYKFNTWVNYYFQKVINFIVELRSYNRIKTIVNIICGLYFLAYVAYMFTTFSLAANGRETFEVWAGLIFIPVLFILVILNSKKNFIPKNQEQ